MKKVAKLVTVSFITRVIVNEDATDEQILAEAKPNYYDKLNNNEIYDNLDSIVDDENEPYNEEDELYNETGLTVKRIAELRQSLEDENISYGELLEIQTEAKRLGIDDEGMMATDTLDEIENKLKFNV